MSLGSIDRRRAAPIVLVVVVAAAVILGFWIAAGRLHALERRVESRRADLERFNALGAEYRLKRAAVEEVSKRAYAPGGAGEGAIAAMEEIARTVGASGGLTSIKPLGGRTTSGYTEKDFEVKLERVDLNQVVNLLYLTENSRTLLVIKEFSMKDRFDEPELLDITLKITHVTKAPVS
ncbi:MAG: hypothetical protein ACE5EI_01610 [Thermodesulfobacteriota bacterium]